MKKQKEVVEIRQREEDEKARLAELTRIRKQEEDIKKQEQEQEEKRLQEEKRKQEEAKRLADEVALKKRSSIDNKVNTTRVATPTVTVNPYGVFVPGLPPPPTKASYTYDELLHDSQINKKPPPECDPSKLESYLSDEGFRQLFKMSKQEFNAQSPWKIRQLKVKARLW